MALHDTLAVDTARKKAVLRWLDAWRTTPGGAAWVAEQLGLQNLRRLRTLARVRGDRRVTLRHMVRSLPWA